MAQPLRSGPNDERAAQITQMTFRHPQDPSVAFPAPRQVAVRLGPEPFHR